VVGERHDRQLLRLDSDGFARAFARRPFAVEHNLVGHPLLALEAIADLADRFPGRIERHRADLPRVLPGEAPELDGPPSETVRAIDDNGCWMVFWYIDVVPEYKELLDSCLDDAESYLPSDIGATHQREEFLFLSAPNAVTPVHFDPEHNFLLQIRGHKDMTVAPFASSENEQRELERYYDGGGRNLEAMPSEGETFGLDPGQGVYVPSFTPHWVKNGPQASISLSITFRTRASRRAERVQRVNRRLRQLRLSPKPPGVSTARDHAKESTWLALQGPKRGLSALRQALTGARDVRSSG
jgi:hypothetical protein